MPLSNAPQTGTGRVQINKGAKEENSSHVRDKVDQNAITLPPDKVAADSLPVRVRDKAEDLATGLREQEEVRGQLVRVADMLPVPALPRHPRLFQGVLPVEEELHRNNLRKGVVVT